MLTCGETPTAVESPYGNDLAGFSKPLRRKVFSTPFMKVVRRGGIRYFRGKLLISFGGKYNFLVKRSVMEHVQERSIPGCVPRGTLSILIGSSQHCSTWNTASFPPDSPQLSSQATQRKPHYAKLPPMKTRGNPSPAPSLARRQTIKGALALASVSLLPKAIAATLNSSPQPLPNGPITSATLAVSSQGSATIGPAFVGLSFEKSKLTSPLFAASNSNLIGLFKCLGSGVLRIGGDSVDQSVWTPSGRGKIWGQIAPSDIDSLAAFICQTSWKCLYAVNLQGAATGATTPALAAAEVAYAAKQLGPSLLGIEIGNEPDAYGQRNKPLAGNWSLQQYIELWQQYRSAILAATPGVAITGPADAENVTTWTIPFAQSVTHKQISMLTQHYYRADGHTPPRSAEFLISVDSRLQSQLTALKTAAQQLGVPYRIAECNSFYNGAAEGVSNSYASALWAIDFLFICAQQGAAGVNFHGGGSGTGYTPIAELQGKIIEARPLFYGILFFTLAGQGTLNTTQLNPANLNATAYAVKAPSGKVNLVVVNKDPNQNLGLTIQLPQKPSSATLITLAQINSARGTPDLRGHSGVTIQGASVGPDGSFAPAPAYTLPIIGSQIKCAVPALSAVMIQIV